MQFAVPLRTTLLVCLVFEIFISSAFAATTIQSATGVSVSVDPSGSYTISTSEPAWSFGGELGTELTSISVNGGSDAVGAYSEISFDYTAEAARHASIRAYPDQSAILFPFNYLPPPPNSSPF